MIITRTRGLIPPQNRRRHYKDAPVGTCFNLCFRPLAEPPVLRIRLRCPETQSDTDKSPFGRYIQPRSQSGTLVLPVHCLFNHSYEAVENEYPTIRRLASDAIDDYMGVEAGEPGNGRRTQGRQAASTRLRTGEDNGQDRARHYKKEPGSRSGDWNRNLQCGQQHSGMRRGGHGRQNRGTQSGRSA